MRLDRLLTIYLFHYLAEINSSNEQIPILMYHSISSSDKNYVHPYFQTNTAPEVFFKHMSYLKQNDYRAINIDNALKIMHSAKPPVHKHVVITFDDGFQDILTNALPILKKFDFSATVYLPTNFISEEGCFFKNNRCLTWQEVRQLQANNIEIGSHTVMHPKLVSLTPQEVEIELNRSKAVIEEKLGKSCNSFSYPYAFPEGNRRFVGLLRKILSRSGYHNCVSTIVGTMEKNADPYFIKRIPVNSDDDEQFFKAKLEGAYNWIHTPQVIFKYAKNIFGYLSNSK